MTEMNPSQAISVLIQGCEIGQKAGAYTFEDSALIHQAIKVFVKEGKKESPENQETEPKEKQNDNNQ